MRATVSPRISGLLLPETATIKDEGESRIREEKERGERQRIKRGARRANFVRLPTCRWNAVDVKWTSSRKKTLEKKQDRNRSNT